MSITPFIKWAGGKQKIVKQILPYLPESNHVYNYYEPFVGAGSIFFATTYNSNYISDKNQELINVYKCLKKDYISTYKYLINIYKKRSKAFYYSTREQFNNNKGNLSTEQSAKFIYLIQSAFNGIYRVNKNGDFNVPLGKLNSNLPSLEQLKQVNKKLKKTIIKCADYSEALSNINKNDFVYIDPPYPPLNGTSNFTHYTIDRFSYNDQIALSKRLNALSNKGTKILISNADTPLIRQLYKKWDIIELNVIRFISCKEIKHKVNELLIKNY